MCFRQLLVPSVSTEYDGTKQQATPLTPTPAEVLDPTEEQQRRDSAEEDCILSEQPPAKRAKRARNSCHGNIGSRRHTFFNQCMTLGAWLVHRSFVQHQAQPAAPVLDHEGQQKAPLKEPPAQQQDLMPKSCADAADTLAQALPAASSAPLDADDGPDTQPKASKRGRKTQGAATSRRTTCSSSGSQNVEPQQSGGRKTREQPAPRCDDIETEGKGKETALDSDPAAWDPLQRAAWHARFDLDSASPQNVLQHLAVEREKLKRRSEDKLNEPQQPQARAARPPTLAKKHSPCCDTSAMDTNQLLEHWKQRPWYSGQVRCVLLADQQMQCQGAIAAAVAASFKSCARHGSVLIHIASCSYAKNVRINN